MDFFKFKKEDFYVIAFFIVIFSLSVVADSEATLNFQSIRAIIIASSFFLVPYFLYVFIYRYHKLQTKIESEKNNKADEELKAKEKKKWIESRLKEHYSIQEKFEKIQKVELIDISRYKKGISENEQLIIEKGGDKQLFHFMKIDTFLRDFKNRILEDQKKYEIALNNRFELISKGQSVPFFRFIYEGTFENRNKTLEYYENIANAMLVFYINDKKMRFFEIYEAFEKLGVFDSTWQKVVLTKLESIDYHLRLINDELSELNTNFTTIVEQSEEIVYELKNIESSIITNNMLSAINTYKTWKINEKLKK